MSKAAKKHEAARRARRAALRDPAKKGAITRATDRLAALAHPDQDYIVIRSEFIYREPARPYPRLLIDPRTSVPAHRKRRSSIPRTPTPTPFTSPGCSSNR